MIPLIKPTDKLVKEYIKKFNVDKRYSRSDRAIANLFNAFPDNNILEHVLLKVSVINDFYSTNIFGTFRMAEHICGLNIDGKIQKGETDAVRLISTGHEIKSKKNNKEIKFYSFATKYCSWHNREKYAIYDSFVEKMLLAYKREHKFSEFKHSDLRDFSKFMDIINDFINYYGLSNHDLKDVDKFLWIYGKEIQENKAKVNRKISLPE